MMVCLLLMAVPFKSVDAQQLDTSRMQQDLRIAESILTELLFEGQSRTRFMGQRVSANYIPGYGVLFEVTPGNFFSEIRVGEMIEIEHENAQPTWTTARGATVDRQTSRERSEAYKNGAKTFLSDYADLLSQVPPDEVIAVIVKPQADQFSVLTTATIRTATVPSSGTATRHDDETKPVSFIMSVKRSNIQDLKSGRISEQQFNQYVHTSDIPGESSTELRIFERILSTGVETSGNSTFSLGRNLTSLVDERLGLIILGSIRSGSSNFVFQTVEGFPTTAVVSDSLPFVGRVVLGTRNINLDSNWDSLRVDIRNANQELVRAREEIDRSVVRINRELGGAVQIERLASNQKSPEELQNDLTSFESTIKNLLIDYGRTLTSIPSDQKIMLHLSMDRRAGNNLPTGIIFAVPKSVLESFDRRGISKEEAMNRIQITRLN